MYSEQEELSKCNTGSEFFWGFKIYAVDLFDERLKLAKRCGATKTINSMSMDVWEFLKLELRKSGLDIFIDNTGNTEIMSKGYDLLNGTGDLVFIGVPKKGDLLKIPSLPLHFGKKITGTHGGEVVPDKDIPRYMRLLKKEILSCEISSQSESS